jgi:squalene-hopene/tetraprenyl-beta-curcumene cyclase
MMHPSQVALPNMNSQLDGERLVAAHETVRQELLGERTVRGHWVGELSGSPLATATAVSALVVAHGNGTLDAIAPERRNLQNLVQGGLSELIVESLHWLAQHQNEDGGWGDTEHGRSNVAATLLVQSAFRLTGVPAKYEGLIERGDEYLEAQGGVATLKKKHGRDKSLTAPILANAALAGLVPWRQVPALPFEYACLPPHWQSRMQLPVVSCALPILATVGQLKFHHDPPRNPVTRLVRLAARKRTLALVEKMQPESGGFMEATPLTAFVVMSLASMGLAQHPVVQRGVEFLLASVRSDASWPIVTNMATWNTSLVINALAERAIVETKGSIADNSLETVSMGAAWHDTARLDDSHSDVTTIASATQPPDVAVLDENCVDWLLDCQRNDDCNCNGAQPGGWSWTDLPGGVPESDDTAGALLALAHMRHRYPHLKQHRLQLAARRGVEWLLELQNSDGGWPTFCRGWSLLAFDRSATDVTAHAVRALAAWEKAWRTDAKTATLPTGLDERISAAIERGMRFLEGEQHNDGSFVPLWFGNQHHPEGHNLVYGTARVLIACQELGRLDGDMAQRAARWLLGVQHANGGWGPPRTSPATSLSNIYRSNSSRAEDALASFCSVEETALAVEALLPLSEMNQLYSRAVRNGLKWLVDAVEQGRHKRPSPIGFYFAKLWYHERLYPLAFATSAMREAARYVAGQTAAAEAVAAHPVAVAPVG